MSPVLFLFFGSELVIIFIFCLWFFRAFCSLTHIEGVSEWRGSGRVGVGCKCPLLSPYLRFCGVIGKEFELIQVLTQYANPPLYHSPSPRNGSTCIGSGWLFLSLSRLFVCFIPNYLFYFSILLLFLFYKLIFVCGVSFAVLCLWSSFLDGRRGSTLTTFTFFHIHERQRVHL